MGVTALLPGRMPRGGSRAFGEPHHRTGKVGRKQEGDVNAVVNDIGVEGSADERIVAALLAKGRLKDADLVRARRLQEETGGNLLTLLARLGLVSERDHAEAAAAVLDLPLVSAKDAPELPPEGVA
jgi:general secretion pathway protein E